MPSTLCTMLPYSIERDPQELLPAIPPIVACAEVLTSTGNQSPCGCRYLFNRSRTTPGCTLIVSASRSSWPMAFKALL